MNRQLYQHHPCYGFQFIPGLKTRMEHEGGGYLLRVNKQGFRCDHDFEAVRRPGKRRVLLFGDSFTAGDGVSNKDRYGDVLERMLPDVEIYNFGLPGSGTDQQYLIFRDWHERLEHDLVVLGLLVENVRRVTARYRLVLDSEGRTLAQPKPYFLLDEQECLSLHNQPVPHEPVPEDQLPPAERQHVDTGGGLQWLRKVVNLLGPWVKEQVVGLSGYQPLPQYDSDTDPGWRLLRSILAQWGGEARPPFVICLIPLYHYIEGAASAASYQARFQELAQSKPSVRLLDPLPRLLESSLEDRRAFRFTKDVHLTPLGHRRLAEALAPGIVDILSSTK